MYFQEAGAASGIGLVQQPVQIVASHELTLFVRQHATQIPEVSALSCRQCVPPTSQTQGHLSVQGKGLPRATAGATE